MIRNMLMLLTVVLFVSCEENFSPKTEFEENYVISCVFGTSGMYETVPVELYLTKTYDVEGLDPNNNKVDPSVAGASVILSYSLNESFLLREDTLVYYDTLGNLIWGSFNRYNNPFIIYRNPSIPLRYTTLTLSVELGNGKVFTSSTKIPRGVFLNYSYDFPHGITSFIDQWRFGNYWGINFEEEEDQLYFSALTFSYNINGDSSSINKTVEVPLEYVKKDGKYLPVYPGYNYGGDLKYKFSAFDRVLSSLSNDAPQGSVITVFDLRLTVVQFDNALGQYYSSINGYLDNYSVRLDERVYSNINGGIGVFGSYRSTIVTHEFDKDYIHSFGYKTRYD